MVHTEPKQRKRAKALLIVGCCFLTLILVGFGFYWKYLEAHRAANRSAADAVFQVKKALTTDQMRCGNLNDKFEKLIESSTKKVLSERTKGAALRCKTTD